MCLMYRIQTGPSVAALQEANGAYYYFDKLDVRREYQTQVTLISRLELKEIFGWRTVRVI